MLRPEVSQITAPGRSSSVAITPSHFVPIAPSHFVAMALSRFLGALGFQVVTVWVLLEVVRKTGSPLLTGTLGLAAFGVSMGFALMGGAVADQVSRPWRTLAVAQFALLLCALGVFTLDLGYGGLLFGWAAISCLKLFRSTLFARALGEMLRRGHAPESLSKWNAFSWQAALLVGPLVLTLDRTLGLPGAAQSVGALCLGGAFAISAALGRGETLASFVQPLSLGSTALPAIRGLRETWSVFLSQRIASRMWLVDSAVTCFAGTAALLPFWLASRGGDAANFVYFRSAFALGSLAAAATIPASWLRDHGSRLFVISLLGVGLGTLSLIGVPSDNGAVGGAALGLLVALGFLDGISVVVRDHEFLRAYSSRGIGSLGALSLILLSASDDLGDFESGVATSSIGVNGALAGGALASLVGAVYWCCRAGGRLVKTPH